MGGDVGAVNIDNVSLVVGMLEPQVFRILVAGLMPTGILARPAMIRSMSCDRVRWAIRALMALTLSSLALVIISWLMAAPVMTLSIPIVARAMCLSVRQAMMSCKFVRCAKSLRLQPVSFRKWL